MTDLDDIPWGASTTGLALAHRFWSKVDKRPNPTGCWLWMGHRVKRGYGLFYHRGTMMGAHRVALMLSGVNLDGLEAAHRCDNPPCVRPSHLFPATHRENQRDMAQKGRAASGDRNGSRTHPERLSHVGGSVPGERNGQSKLTLAEVVEIRASDESGRVLARRYGVQPSTISRIRNGMRWR